MKTLTKLFVCLMWVVALAGAWYGWLQVVQSGGNMSSVMQKVIASAGKRPAASTVFPLKARGNAAVLPIDDAAMSSHTSEDTVETLDFSCLKTTSQLAQQTIEQYLAEYGRPMEKVDLQTNYDKTPSQLKTTSAQRGTCSTDYLYCDANTCRYSIEYMQKQNSTAAVLVGVLLTEIKRDWDISCLNMSDFGAHICATYNQ